MLRRPHAWKIVAVAGLLLVSAGAGLAWYEDDDPAGAAPASAAESPQRPDAPAPRDGSPSVAADGAALSPGDVEGNVLESFSGSFGSAPSTGALDLRIDDGPVRVVGWDEPRYEVLVLQGNGTDSPSSDRETEVTFDDASGRDRIELSLVVDRQGTYGVGVQTDAASTGDGHAHPAAIAFVPASTTYESVTVCSGQEHAFERAWEDAWGSVPWPWSRGDDVDGEGDCVPGDESPHLQASVDARLEGNDNGSRHDPGFVTGASGLEGESLRVATGHGDAAVEDVSFAQATILSGHGDLEVRDAAVGNATLLAGHGDVLVQGAQGADLSIYTDHGDVAAGFTPAGSGLVDVASDHGGVQVELAPAGPGAYDVLAGTDHGDLTLAVANATVERADREDNTSWQDPGYWTGILEEEEGYDETASARTQNWDGAGVRTDVVAGTDHGDVLVTDGEASVVWADAGGEGGGDA